MKKIIIPKSVLEDLYIEQRIPSTKIANKFNCHHSVIFKRMREYGIKAREKSEAMTIYPKVNFSGNLKEKAYMIGFRTGDLWVNKINKNGKTILIQCNSTRNEQINLVEKLFSKYGHIKTSLVKDPQGNNETRISCYVNDSFSFLLKKKDKIKKWILDNNEYFFAFLAGYVDAEGHIGVHKYGGAEQACLIISSYDSNILLQIWSKLSSLNIRCPKPRIGHFEGYVTERKKLPYRRDYWILNTYSKMSLLILLNILANFIKHEKRLSDLQDALNNINVRNEKFGNLRMEMIDNDRVPLF